MEICFCRFILSLFVNWYFVSQWLQFARENNWKRDWQEDYRVSTGFWKYNSRIILNLYNSKFRTKINVFENYSYLVIAFCHSNKISSSLQYILFFRNFVQQLFTSFVPLMFFLLQSFCSIFEDFSFAFSSQSIFFHK